MHTLPNGRDSRKPAPPPKPLNDHDPDWEPRIVCGTCAGQGGSGEPCPECRAVRLHNRAHALTLGQLFGDGLTEADEVWDLA